MNGVLCAFSRRRWRCGSLALCVGAVLVAVSVGAVACGGTTGTDKGLARDLGSQLSEELRAYQDTGLTEDLERARATCVEIEAEANTGRLYGTEYGRALASACDLVDVLGTDPRYKVDSAISLVDLALQMLD
jgi:hypothetical protein